MRSAIQYDREGLRTWIEVDTAVLGRNLRALRRVLTEKTKLMVVVKSNAYGHGLLGAARVAEKAGADWLGVDSMHEGATLRNNRIRLPILILGYTPGSDLMHTLTHNLDQIVYDKNTIRLLARHARRLRKNAYVHIKIETGTSRQGITPEALTSFLAYIKRYPEIRIRGIYTHFAETENPKSRFYRTQLTILKKAAAILGQSQYIKPILHAAASSATLLYSETHLDMVRVGISYYGLWPSREVERLLGKQGVALKPALTWKTRIAQLKWLERGTTVGYDRTERVRRRSHVAVLPVGYWDGYDRGLSRIGEVLIRGKRCRVLGRVCMNMIVIDVTDLRNLHVGEPVTLLGGSRKSEISAEEIAKKIGTINYEVVTRINPLIPRLYL